MEPTTEQIVEATKQFLLRANLAGGEVATFNIIMGWLDQQAADTPAE